METAPIPSWVMRVQPGKTPIESSSVPGPHFVQSEHGARTEWVDEGHTTHTRLAVATNMNMSTETNEHSHTSTEHGKSKLCSLFRPLFHVGSFISVRISRRGAGRMLSHGLLLHVEGVLSHYEYILSDGERWSVQHLIRYKDTTKLGVAGP